MLRALLTILALLLGAAAAGSLLLGVRAADGVPIPAQAGSEWQIVAGYNTGTHSEADRQDPYAIDIVRLDAPTADSPVLAPTAGTIGYLSSDCLTIRDHAGMGHLLCHINPRQGLTRGAQVEIGEQIGTVWPNGYGNNGGLAHIHYAVHHSQGAGQLGRTVPFTGPYTIEGIELHPGNQANLHAGSQFTSTNRPNWQPPTTHETADGSSSADGSAGDGSADSSGSGDTSASGGGSADGSAGSSNAGSGADGGSAGSSGNGDTSANGGGSADGSAGSSGSGGTSANGGSSADGSAGSSGSGGTSANGGSSADGGAGGSGADGGAGDGSADSSSGSGGTSANGGGSADGGAGSSNAGSGADGGAGDGSTNGGSASDAQTSTAADHGHEHEHEATTATARRSATQAVIGGWRMLAIDRQITLSGLWSKRGATLTSLFYWNRNNQTWQRYAPHIPGGAAAANLTLQPGDAVLGAVQDGAAWLPRITPAPTPPTLQLQAGWNLVSWHGPTTPLTEALANLTPSLTAAHLWNNETQQYHHWTPTTPTDTPTQIPPATTLWLHLTTPHPWPQHP